MSASERQLAWIWAGLALATAALSPVWIHLAPLLRPCLFRQVTGVPCPSCGATRGVLALMDGRVLEALTFNPLMVTGFAAFLAGGALAPLWAWRINRVPDIVHPLPLWVRLGAVLAILANWAWVVVQH
jgi:hypothetical protein